MKYLTLIVLAVLCAVGSEAQTKVAPASPRIYVDPATGFDAYLSEAAARQHVPITLTTNKTDADYEFDAISGGQTVYGGNWSILWTAGYGKAWIRLVNLNDSGLVFARALGGSNEGGRGLKAAAESCVKRLRGVARHSAHPSDTGVRAFVFGAPQWNF